MEPKLAVVACLFLACKVEECAVDADSLCRQLFPSKAATPDELAAVRSSVLQLECAVLSDLCFDVRLVHPLRPLRGLCFSGAVAWGRGPAEAEEVLTAARPVLVSAAVLTDVELLYPPTQVALAALVVAARSTSTPQQSTAAVEAFFGSQQFLAKVADGDQAKLATLRTNIARIQELIEEGTRNALTVEQATLIDRKLKTGIA
jgi:hypothetical protein